MTEANLSRPQVSSCEKRAIILTKEVIIRILLLALLVVFQGAVSLHSPPPKYSVSVNNQTNYQIDFSMTKCSCSGTLPENTNDYSFFCGGNGHGCGYVNFTTKVTATIHKGGDLIKITCPNLSIVPTQQTVIQLYQPDDCQDTSTFCCGLYSR